VTDEIMQRPEHKWVSGEMSQEDRAKISGYYKSRYGAAP
jgi:hypothetical protein